jgi:SAM-dependent methyltransferase
MNPDESKGSDRSNYAVSSLQAESVTGSAPAILEHIACDLCGTPEYHVRYRKPDDYLWLDQFEYPVVECVSCGLVYLNPRPTQEAMTRFYDTDYHEGRETEEQRKRYEQQLKLLPALSDENVLDIGCARGDFLSYLLEQAPNVRAVGVDAFSNRVSNSKIEFHQTLLPAYAAEIKGECFDLITAWAVIEHVHEPSAYFAAVHRLLKPGGSFIFLVTNSESWYGRRAFIEDVPRHTYHFSESTVMKYSIKHGFRECRCIFNDDIFDGRGFGTFRYSFARWGGETWEKMYFKKVPLIARLLGMAGRQLDRIIFRSHWEARLRKSGIMIVEFRK